MTPTLVDHQYMVRAIQLARQGLYTTDPNPRVGCVLVKDSQIVGEGYHQKAGELHAERLAIKAAGEQAHGATAYVTLEPCCHQGRTSACTQGLLEAGIQRVFAAMQDPNPRVAGKGLQQLAAAGVQTHSGLLEADARALNPGFIKRMTQGLPFVRLKLAMSVDGRTAMANGESQWITGESARADVQRLRAHSSAVVTGIGTVLADDPALNVRLPETKRQPLRVVLDSQARMATGARLLQSPDNVAVFVGEQADQEKCEALSATGVAINKLVADSVGRLPLIQVMQLLAEQYEINEVLLECGATLAGAALQANIVDELVVYMAPHLMGNATHSLVNLPGVEQMAQRINLQLQDVRQVGADVRMTFRQEQ